WGGHSMTNDQPQGRGYGSLLRRRGFLALMTAQFLGSLNDNILKMTVVLVATGASEATNAEAASFIAAVGGAFILPFLLFSGWAGQLADRRRKDRVVATVKLFEIPAMLIAIPALMSGQEWAMLGALFLVSSQAAFFSPAKYGILPEILDSTELSRGNALLE